MQVCVQDFCEELEYWGLDDLHMEPCCQHTYYRARWLLPKAEEEGEKEEDFGSGSCASTQRHLWNLFENPHHSRAAKVSREKGTIKINIMMGQNRTVCPGTETSALN